MANIAGVLAAMLAWKGKQRPEQPAKSAGKPPEPKDDRPPERR